MTSTAGTTMSDYMDRTPAFVLKGAAILVAILFSLLALWRFTVGNVSRDNIHSEN